MQKTSLIILLHFLSFILSLKGSAQKALEIVKASHATHVVSITTDSLILKTGSTYSFTIDTPEDAGLASTGLTVEQINEQIKSKDGSIHKYNITDSTGVKKLSGIINNRDNLIVSSSDGIKSKTYAIGLKKYALSGNLFLEQNKYTVKTEKNITLYFTAGQRTPNASIKIELPEGVHATLENTTVNVIGRGEVKLKDLSNQSIGRVGSAYSYSKVGKVKIESTKNGGSVIIFNHIDLRPYNGVDLKITIHKVLLTRTGAYPFKAMYKTTEPEVLVSQGIDTETATLHVVDYISDFKRVHQVNENYQETFETFKKVNFEWTPNGGKQKIKLMQSIDHGATWLTSSAVVDPERGSASISNLAPNQLYTFKLKIKDGTKEYYSNKAYFLSGKVNIKNFGVTGKPGNDDTEKINEAIDSLNRLGGGILMFSKGEYNVRTVHLKSNVWLYIDKGATINALTGADAPRPTWFSDAQYRTGISPTQIGPYIDPENWLTKQDIGHTFFNNAMFFAEREDNIKIIGNGRISGNNNLYTGSRVANRPINKRGDKMFSLKLCSNIEIGGIYREDDLWYDEYKDEPYYLKNGKKDFNTSNMLQIDQAGHFALLATGTDDIYVHDTYFGKVSSENARDLYDFMQCNNVIVTNIYSKLSSDDIIKLGSDCSLGFTRPVSNYRVRNIIGDTHCNLFQIGSETADDIMDVHVDNIYVLGADKAGFSISTNDGAHVKDVHLNCGHTGTIHSRSKMYRTTAPFFISISNRARILGATVGRYKFNENGIQHDELLANNVNIGLVENIILNGVDISEVYKGSSYKKDVRWKPYDGSQEKATPIVAGYKLPDSDDVEGGLNFKLPNGEHTGYIKNISFKDINVLVKGGNYLEDINKIPPELGVGQYNVPNLGVQPSYGLWVRHVKELYVEDCSFNYEKRDSRYPLFFHDVLGAKIQNVKTVCADDNHYVLGLKQASNVTLKNVTCYDSEWGDSGMTISDIFHKAGDGKINKSN
ncbi:endopygalactorunase [Aestuariibaculum suncheonense]|uniref:Endopygalactorunase n=1 Tax=Aestuariibaculum suncheonense TaxID=1028745 RepID=A0A8J6Q5K0_9FLAO|nr:endopygalactorunase [Aestuariibaculum suncheonense]MBD0834757.1 endopygalactorunase [Aestuariibaculum suncheonense]